MSDHRHDWHIWPETDGLEQRCAICREYRRTPEEDKFWLRPSAQEPEASRPLAEPVAKVGKFNYAEHTAFEILPGMRNLPEGDYLLYAAPQVTEAPGPPHCPDCGFIFGAPSLGAGTEAAERPAVLDEVRVLQLAQDAGFHVYGLYAGGEKFVNVDGHCALRLAAALRASLPEATAQPAEPMPPGGWQGVGESWEDYRARAEATAQAPALSEREQQPIPIAAGKRIADEFGYDQIVIVGRRVGGFEHVTTYGKDKANCDVAARMGNFFKHKLMGWPEEKLATPEARPQAPEATGAQSRSDTPKP